MREFFSWLATFILVFVIGMILSGLLVKYGAINVY